MALEDLTGASKYIDDLINTNPASGDSKGEGDDHIRGIKNVLLNTFPNVTGAITATQDELNNLDGYTGNTNDLNILSAAAAAGVTAAEFQYINGVTSAIQTQLDAKQGLDAQLTDIAGLAVTDGGFIVGDGANFVLETGATARASIGIDGSSGNIASGDIANDAIGHDKKNWAIGSQGSLSVTSSGTVIPEGLYLFYNWSIGGASSLEVNDGSVWRTAESGWTGGLIASDGTNVRLADSGGPSTAYYRRFS